MLDRLDFLLRIRLGRRPMAVGLVFLGALVLSLSFALSVGNARARRVLFFPAGAPGRVAIEDRYLPNHRGLEGDLRELVDGEILGPTRRDAALLFPRDVRVRSLFVRSRVVYIDLSPELVFAGPEQPLHGEQALALLDKSIRFNFPRVREVVYTVDGQAPRFAAREKNH